MAKKKWYTEEELCDLIHEEARDMGSICDETVANGSLFREYEFPGGVRPDFFGYEQLQDGTRLYTIIEVKISADATSVAQLANYQWIFNKHIRNSSRAESEKLDKVKVQSFLLAKIFDRSTYSVAAECGIRLWRITPVEKPKENDPRILIEEEIHPFEETPNTSWFMDLLIEGDPVDFHCKQETGKDDSDEIRVYMPESRYNPLFTSFIERLRAPHPILAQALEKAVPSDEEHWRTSPSVTVVFPKEHWSLTKMLDSEPVRKIIDFELMAHLGRSVAMTAFQGVKGAPCV